MPSLRILNFGINHLKGNLPDEICHQLPFLEVLDVTDNQLEGSIPQSMANCTSLKGLYLVGNSFTGFIPKDIGNLVKLEILALGENNLSGPIPPNIFNISTLTVLHLSDNFLSGPLPSYLGINLPNLKKLLLVRNGLTGPIPNSLSNASKLISLGFSVNKFDGVVPNVLGNLTNMMDLALGSNDLIGCFGNTSLRKLDFSSNNLISQIPDSLWSLNDILHLDISSNAPIGMISPKFWIAYKATLSNEEIVAVKVFNSDMEEASRSFDIECAVMRNLRHHNLIKIISSCSNDHFKSLIMEFMENGSLDRWLYSHSYYLDVLQRLNIMIDVALALEYLHHGSPTLVVHCDVKPSNVLLDKDMVAHLSDFGISKLFSERQSEIYTKTLATIGYMAL
ncbi:hypothetical protein K1719_040588 [Acacia pycnantha]|nr:hypothetical protein K1719_040588 [Acacia pycnantha]